MPPREIGHQLDPSSKLSPDGLIAALAELESARAQDLADWTGASTTWVTARLKEAERTGRVRRDGELWSMPRAKPPPAPRPPAPPPPAVPAPPVVAEPAPAPAFDPLEELRWLVEAEPGEIAEPHDGTCRYRIAPPTRGGRLEVTGELVRRARSGMRELAPLRWPADASGLFAVRPVRPEDVELHARIKALDELYALAGGTDAPRAVAHEVREIVRLLATCGEVRFEDEPIRVSAEPLTPRLCGERQAGGALKLCWKPAIRALWATGDVYVLTDEGALHPLSSELPARLKRRLRKPLPTLDATAIPGFVEQLVIDGGLDVELPPELLAPVDPVSSEAWLRLWEEGDALRVSWSTRYRVGDGEVEVPGGRRGVLARAPGGGVFRRDLRVEHETAERFRRDFGASAAGARLLGDDAYDVLEWIRDGDHTGWRIAGADGLLRFKVGGNWTPRVTFGDAVDWFDLDVEFVFEDHVLTLEEALRHWEEGRRFVPLGDGRVASLPGRWLLKHTPIALEYAAIRQRRKKAWRWAALSLRPLIEDSGGELPPALLAQLSTLDGDPEPRHHRLVHPMRPYQERGFAWMSRLKEEELGGVLADDMGLGKTIQTLALLADVHASPGPPSLVLAPRSVVRNWTDEAAKWAPHLRVREHLGATRSVAFLGCDVVVTSYGTFHRDQDELIARQWSAVILDEAQTVKNLGSQTRRAAGALRARYRFALTGTPLENDLVELYSVLDLVNPGFFGSPADFQRRYAVPIQRRHDADALERLRDRTRPFLLRRRKSEVTPELPPVQWTTLTCVLEEGERAVYLAVRDAVRIAVREKLHELGLARARVDILGQIGRLRMAACDAGLLPYDAAREVEISSKVRVLLESLETVVAEGHRALVFSQWPSLLHRIEPHLQERGWGYLLLEGATRSREELVRRFQAPDGPPLFLISLRAGGVGLNLAAADHVFLMDPWWNPATEAQAVDRAHRIGQTRPVTVYRLIADDTIEGRILALQAEKRALFDEVLGEPIRGAALDERDVEALLAT